MGQAKQRGSFEERVAALWAQYGVAPMTPERYNAFVSWTRSPIADIFGTEVEFFASQDERLIGVIVQDNQDRDFRFMTLGRDEKGRYRGIDMGDGATLTAIRHRLFKSIKEHADTGQTMFPQGIEPDDKAGVDLFTPVVAPEKLHKDFVRLKEGDHWIPARSILSEMMRHLVDPDGNLVEQFQTTGFDARLWEIYLYAALLELGLFVDKPSPAPDFRVSRGSKQVFIEAVTVNPTQSEQGGVSPQGPPERSLDEIKELLKTKIPIKFGSPLYTKLMRKNPYWELDAVKGHPLVFAIADFHETQSMTWTSPALLEYLYGVTHDFHLDDQGKLIISSAKLETHEYEGKKIPSGFFLQPHSENVSAVLFTSSGTISKFTRMGALAGFNPGFLRITRTGLRHTHDPNAIFPTPFSHQVRQGVVKETWAEGLSMFHNPSAKHPVDPDLFPGVAHHFYRNGQIESILPEFHVYSSHTWNIAVRPDAPTEAVPGAG